MKPQIKIIIASILLAAVPVMVGAALTQQNLSQNAQEPKSSGGLSIFSPTPPPNTSCGTIIQTNTSVVQDPSDAVSCFLNARQSCSTLAMGKTLTFHQLTNTVSTVHTFMVKNGGGTCDVTDTILSGGPESTTQHFFCNNAIQQNGGLLFSNCETEGSIFIPPAQ